MQALRPDENWYSIAKTRNGARMTRVTTTRFAGAAMLAWVLGHAGLALAQAPDSRLADLDAYVEQVRSDWQFPGLAVAVVEGDRVLYVKGFGVRQKGRAEKVDADT